MFGILSYKSWLIEPGFAQRMAPLLYRALQQGTLENFFEKGRESNEKILSRLYSGVEAERMYETDGPAYYVASAKNGSKVAIVTMMGSLTKNGEECTWGSRDYQNALAGIAKRPNIDAVVIHFNNAPGGSVDGTAELAAVIKGFSKPTLSFVDGYAASAHYWLASQTGHIMMSKLNPSEVGSIGALILAQNVQNMIQAGELPSMEIIRAPQSVNKALFNVIEPLTDEIKSDLQEDLRAVVKDFIGAVKQGRGAALKEDATMFTGPMFGTSAAIANGLADSKGTLIDAINKAGQLAKQKSTPAPALSSAQVNTNMKFKSQWLSNLLGKSEKAAEEKPSAETQTEPTMEAADAKVAELETANVSLTADNEAQKTKITELEKSVTDLQGQVTSLTSEKETLSTEKAELQKKLDAAPTGKETTIITKEEKDAKVSTDPIEAKKSFRSQADEEADQYVAASRATAK